MKRLLALLAFGASFAAPSFPQAISGGPVSGYVQHFNQAVCQELSFLPGPPCQQAVLVIVTAQGAAGFNVTINYMDSSGVQKSLTKPASASPGTYFFVVFQGSDNIDNVLLQSVTAVPLYAGTGGNGTALVNEH